jgi:hypothetical protein
MQKRGLIKISFKELIWEISGEAKEFPNILLNQEYVK